MYKGTSLGMKRCKYCNEVISPYRKYIHNCMDIFRKPVKKQHHRNEDANNTQKFLLSSFKYKFSLNNKRVVFNKSLLDVDKDKDTPSSQLHYSEFFGKNYFQSIPHNLKVETFHDDESEYEESLKRSSIEESELRNLILEERKKTLQKNVNNHIVSTSLTAEKKKKKGVLIEEKKEKIMNVNSTGEVNLKKKVKKRKRKKKNVKNQHLNVKRELERQNSFSVSPSRRVKKKRKKPKTKVHMETIKRKMKKRVEKKRQKFITKLYKESEMIYRDQFLNEGEDNNGVKRKKYVSVVKRKGKKRGKVKKKKVLKRGEGKRLIKKVPEEAYDVIFTFLEYKDLVNMKYVCKSWFYLSFSNKMWKELVLRDKKINIKDVEVLQKICDVNPIHYWFRQYLIYPNNLLVDKILSTKIYLPNYCKTNFDKKALLEYKRFDRDKDGIISVSDLLLFYRNERSDRMITRDVVEKILKNNSREGNDFITFEEFKDILREEKMMTNYEIET